jgi:mannose-1-phosphate guanylyltransferase
MIININVKDLGNKILHNKKTKKKLKSLPVILAGGSGTRLWPLSRKSYSKQFYNLYGEGSMLQQTLARVVGEDVLPALIICNDEVRFLVAEQLREIADKTTRILLEPEARNTAPAIALGALEAVKGGDDPILIVMPADHIIRDNKAFNNAVNIGIELAENGALVTLGIQPANANVGYGYIKKGKPIENHNAYQIDSFKEKPTFARANSYIKSKNFLWNSGIFIFKASKYLQELGYFRPEITSACRRAFGKRRNDLSFLRIGAIDFLKCPSESIDYAVMETTINSVVIPVDMGWSDLGSWDSLWDISKKDGNANYISGDVINIDGSRNYIVSKSRLVTTVGIDDTVVIETKDAIFISPRNKLSKIKELILLMQDHDRIETEEHREVYRPWGKFESLDVGERYQVKKISVKPGEKLSVQTHQHRSEHWVVVQGIATVRKGDNQLKLAANESVYIPVGEIHSLKNDELSTLEIIEVQTGSYLGEDDIIRIQDKYGRK